MKILFLNHNLIWRGSFFRCLGFARELVKLGHRVDIWTVSNQHNPDGTIETIDGVRVWQTPRLGNPVKHDGGYSPWDIINRMLSVMGYQWDVIHAFEHRPNVFLPWMWKRFLRSNSSSTLFLADWSDWWTAGGIITAKRRYAWMDRAERVLEEKSKVWADGVTVISRPLYERALNIGISPDNIAWIPSGVDVESFPVLDKQESRRDVAFPQDKYIMGFVGFSLWDMQLLADMFEIICQKRNDICLVVIGGGVEEKQKDIFRSKFSLNNQVYLPGVVPFESIPKWLACCDVLLLPLEDNRANQARLPNKLMDYLAAGRPVLTTNVGDAAQIVHQNNAGAVCSPNAKAMAHECHTLLSHPDRVEQCGKNARKTAQNQFAYSHLAKKWLTFYQMQFKKIIISSIMF